MSSLTNEAHARLFKKTVIAKPPTGSVYVSPPMKVTYLRWGTVQVVTSNNGSEGGTIKFYGTNVYPVTSDGGASDEINPQRIAQTFNVPVTGGVVTLANLALAGWMDMSIVNAQFGLNLPGGGGNINDIFPKISTPFDPGWLVLVVASGGPGSITIDAWAKFKGGA